MAAILNSAILNLAILDSATLGFPLKLTHTCQDWFPPFAERKTFTHSFWLNLMMAAILNSTMLDSDTLFCSLRFTPKHSPSTLTLTQTNSIWLKFIHSDSTWWWQPSWILPCWIKKPSLIHSDSTWWWQPSWILPCWIKKPSLIHSDSTWWWQPSWILPCWIQTPCFLLSDSLKNTLTPLWLWLKLIQSDSNSFILTQLDDGSHLEFGHLGFSHLSFSSQTHSHLPRLVHTICTKKPSLIHSDSTWWWQSSWILLCWIQTMPSWIQPSKFFLSNSLTLAKIGSHHLHKKNLHSFILTQLDDGSHLEFYHVGLKNFIHSFWLNLMMAAILNSAMLDSDTLFSSLRFTPKHSPSTLTLTQTNSIWLKFIHSDSTWWWQTPWNLPGWIQTLPSWIQTPSYLLSDLLQNTLPPLWLWLQLIQSD